MHQPGTPSEKLVVTSRDHPTLGSILEIRQQAEESRLARHQAAIDADFIGDNGELFSMLVTFDPRAWGR